MSFHLTKSETSSTSIRLHHFVFAPICDNPSNVIPCQASSQLAAEVGKVTEFLDNSRDRRRWAEEGVRGLQTSLKAAAKRTAEVKRGYEARAREEIQANHTYHQVRRGVKLNLFMLNFLQFEIDRIKYSYR